MEDLLKYQDYRIVLDFPYQQEEKQPKTFQTIAGQPHYENVNSNLLKFFFCTDEEHGLRDLFLSSLLALINRKKNIHFTMNDCHCVREKTTQRKGRIDLLLQDSDNKKYIIIENKIQHTVNNDLQDYYDSVDNIAEEDKVGVLLTIEATELGHPKFVNITHRELCDQVLANLGMYYATASDKYLYFLKDYIQNMNTFYKPESMKQNISFFIEHQQKIQNIANLKKDVLDHIREEGKKAGARMDFSYDGREEYLYLMFLSKSDALYVHYYYTIIFSNFVHDATPEIKITLEMYGLDEHQITTLLEASPGFSQQNEKINIANAQPVEDWFYYAYQSYHLAPHELVNLSDFLYEKIQLFEPIRKEVYQILTTNKRKRRG